MKYSRDTQDMSGLATKAASSLIGAALIAVGTVWVLQGLNIAFRVGFMVGDRHWAVYGAISAAAGIAQILWSWRRAS